MEHSTPTVSFDYAFASEQLDNGPILVASEGMRFDVKHRSCKRLKDHGSS